MVGEWLKNVIGIFEDELIRRLCNSCTKCKDHEFGNYCDNMAWIKTHIEVMKQDLKEM